MDRLLQHNNNRDYTVWRAIAAYILELAAGSPTIVYDPVLGMGKGPKRTLNWSIIGLSPDP